MKNLTISEAIQRNISALSLDKMFPRQARFRVRFIARTALLLTTTIGLVSFLLRISNHPYAESIPIWLGGFMGLISMGLLLAYLTVYGLDIFVISNMFGGLSSSFDVPHLYDRKDKVSYDVQHMFFRKLDRDPLISFLQSFHGQELMRRLSIDQGSLREYLETKQPTLVVDELESFRNGTELLLPRHIAEILYNNDLSWQEFLVGQQVTTSVYTAANYWTERISRRRDYALRWWSRDYLSRYGQFGTFFAYGDAFELEKYSRKVYAPLERDIFVPRHISEVVRKTETALGRKNEPNALIVSNSTIEREEVLEEIVRRGNIGISHPTLRNNRLMVLNTSSLIAAFGDKNSLENELLKLFKQAIKARGITIVFDDLNAFVEGANTLGSDPIGLLKDFLASPAIKTIGLMNSNDYHEHHQNDLNLSQHFEMIEIPELSIEPLEEELMYHAQLLEKKHPVLVSYTAIHALATGAKRYLPNPILPDDAIVALESITSTASESKVGTVTKESVTTYLESKTGIPLNQTNEQNQRLLNLESLLQQRVVGQNKAIVSVSNTLRRLGAQLTDGNKPIGTFLFVGPTGVGKTEIAKTLAHVFFGSSDTLIRLDMSEYQSTEGLTKLIGSFATKESGVLTTLVRSRPYGVLLLDEFEKVHPHVLDLFLQIFDEGRFSDMNGTEVNCQNLIIIATSNAGSEIIWENPNLSKDEYVDIAVSRQSFKPELLNRFDDLIIFHPLSQTDVQAIATIHLENLRRRLIEQGITFIVNEETAAFVATVGYNEKLGARPMKRAIQDYVETRIAERKLSGQLEPGSTIELHYNRELNRLE